MPLPDLIKIVSKNISRTQRNASPNGVFTLKGGDVQEEIRPYRNIAEVMDIHQWFNEDWFKQKHLIYIPL